MGIKQAFFFDIDGTLYFGRFHKISPATLHALKTLKEKGFPVYLVTSRSVHELKNLPKDFLEIPFDGMILEGGALVLDENRNPVQTLPMDLEDMETIRRYCEDNQLVWRYSTLDGNYFGRTPEKIHRYIMNRMYLNCPVFKEYESDEAFNILVWIHSGGKRPELESLLHDSNMIVYKDAVEIRRKQASKEQAIKDIVRKNRYGRVFCFGDGENDVNMLKLADVGVAMANGTPACKEAANVICPSVEEDGVACFLKEQGLI